ncbi:hypothetical protein BV378_20395 [Nostoc sp. RF31YmG]|jgi:hypothetical protein|nr:hypothetical protein BV378_20395 [Nostoc sp. RF31YmG]
MTEPKFKQGDIVDTPYHGRRQILRVWWLGKSGFDEHEGCWMYEIEPPKQGNIRFSEYGGSYSETHVNQGLAINVNSGLDLRQFKPTYPPTYQNSPYYQNPDWQGEDDE